MFARADRPLANHTRPRRPRGSSSGGRGRGVFRSAALRARDAPGAVKRAKGQKSKRAKEQKSKRAKEQKSKRAEEQRSRRAKGREAKGKGERGEGGSAQAYCNGTIPSLTGPRRPPDSVHCHSAPGFSCSFVLPFLRFCSSVLLLFCPS